MLNKYSDEQIVAMIQEGGRSCEVASDALLSQFERIIFSYARRNGATIDDAKDIVAETVTAVVMNIIKKKYVLNSPLGAYFKTIYERKTIKYVHRKKNTDSLLLSDDESDITNNPNLPQIKNPFEILTNKDLHLQMHRAIKHLQENCNVIFKLTFFNYSMKEIGEILLEKQLIKPESNLENTAKSQHKRCKEGLKEIISTKFPELINYYKQ